MAAISQRTRVRGASERRLSGGPQPAGEPAADLPRTRASRLQGVFTTAYRDIVEGRADLPALPGAAAQLTRLLGEQDYRVDDIVRIVQSDPAAAAYLLRAANSALYRRRVPITDLKTAIGRFGGRTTRNLLLSYSMRAVFRARSPLFRELLDAVWRDSMMVGAIAAVIARRLLPDAVDEALLAGLLHDIGSLPLIQQFQAAGLEESDRSRIDEALQRYAPIVGVTLLDHWRFDEALKKVVRHARDWLHFEATPLDLVDVTLLARLHARIATGRAATCPKLIDMPLFDKLPGEALSPRLSLRFIEEAREDVREVLALLGG